MIDATLMSVSLCLGLFFFLSRIVMRTFIRNGSFQLLCRERNWFGDVYGVGRVINSKYSVLICAHFYKKKEN